MNFGSQKKTHPSDLSVALYPLPITDTQEELTEGYYFCPHCNAKTMHELHPQVLPHYETASEEEIVELEKNCTLFCMSCTHRAEAAYREEVYAEVDADPYGYITPALDEDDDSGLSDDFEEDDDYFDPYYGDEYDRLHNSVEPCVKRFEV